MLREHSSSRKAFSAIFVCVTTAGTVYTEQKQKKWGREEKSQVLLYTGLNSTHAGSRPELGRLTFESHMYSGIEAQKRQQFSFARWIKKVILQI